MEELGGEKAEGIVRLVQDGVAKLASEKQCGSPLQQLISNQIPDNVSDITQNYSTE